MLTPKRKDAMEKDEQKDPPSEPVAEEAPPEEAEAPQVPDPPEEDTEAGEPVRKIIRVDNLSPRQLLELDACTHCGTCSLHCSVAPVFSKIPNTNIFPSEKLTALKTLAANKQLATKEIYSIHREA